MNVAAYAVSAVGGVAITLILEFLYRIAPYRRGLHVWYLANLFALAVNWVFLTFDLLNGITELGPAVLWNLYRLFTDDWWRKKRKQIAAKLRGYKARAKLAALRVFRPPKAFPMPT